MWWLVAFFAAAGLYFNEIRFMVSYQDEKLKVFWLPRVFGGYTKPVSIYVYNAERKDSSVERPGLRRFLGYFVRRIIGRIGLRGLDFLLLPGYKHARCIIAVRAKDIIGSSVYAAKKTLRYQTKQIEKGKRRRR